MSQLADRVVPTQGTSNDPTDPNTKTTTYMAIALERNVTALGKT